MNGLSTTCLKKFEANLILLLVNGLSDENEEIKMLCINLIEDVGLKRKLLALELEEKIDEFLDS